MLGVAACTPRPRPEKLHQDEDHQGQPRRGIQIAGRRSDPRDRDQVKIVRDQDKQEQRHRQRPDGARALAAQVIRHEAVDEIKDRLQHVLHTARPLLGEVQTHPQRQGQDDRQHEDGHGKGVDVDLQAKEAAQMARLSPTPIGVLAKTGAKATQRMRAHAADLGAGGGHVP